MKKQVYNKDNGLIRLPPHIKDGGVAVIPTDTVYGIVASVHSPEAVKKLYELKERPWSKACIVLIPRVDALRTLGISITNTQEIFLSRVWPGPVSIRLPVSNKTLPHIPHDHGTLAFRVPNNVWLQELLEDTGPLIAPSANKSGEPVSKTGYEASETFGSEALYVDDGMLSGAPSVLIDLRRVPPQILRGEERQKVAIERHITELFT